MGATAGSAVVVSGMDKREEHAKNLNQNIFVSLDTLIAKAQLQPSGAEQGRADFLAVSVATVQFDNLIVHICSYTLGLNRGVRP